MLQLLSPFMTARNSSRGLYHIVDRSRSTGPPYAALCDAQVTRSSSWFTSTVPNDTRACIRCLDAYRATISAVIPT